MALPLWLRGVGRRGRAPAWPSCSSGSAWPAAAAPGRRSYPAASANASPCARRSPTGPRLLLADEPTGELDADSALAVRELIAEVTRDADATTILVSHDAASASVADRTLVIRDGRVAEDLHPAPTARSWSRRTAGCGYRRSCWPGPRSPAAPGSRATPKG